EDSWLLTDDEFLADLEQRSIGPRQDVRETVRRLRAGELYTPLAILSSPSVHKYAEIADWHRKRQLENSVTDRLRQHNGMSGHVLIHPILDKKKTARSVTVHVLDTGKRVTVGTDSSKVHVGIFLASAISEKMVEGLRRTVTKFFTDMGLENI